MVNGSASVVLCRHEQATQEMGGEPGADGLGSAAGSSCRVDHGCIAVAVAASASSDGHLTDVHVRNSAKLAWDKSGAQAIKSVFVMQ